MVIRDNDREPCIPGQTDSLPVGDARVAGQEHVGPAAGVVQDFLELPKPDAVAFCEAVGHMEIHMRGAGQFPQCGHQQSGAGLAVHVEVPPDEDALTGCHSSVEQVRGPIQAHQRGGRRGRVLLNVQEGESFLGRVQAALNEELGDQGVAAYSVAQLRRRLGLGGKNPRTGHQKASSSTSSRVNSRSVSKSMAKSSASSISSNAPAWMPRSQRDR